MQSLDSQYITVEPLKATVIVRTAISASTKISSLKKLGVKSERGHSCPRVFFFFHTRARMPALQLVQLVQFIFVGVPKIKIRSPDLGIPTPGFDKLPLALACGVGCKRQAASALNKYQFSFLL